MLNTLSIKLAGGNVEGMERASRSMRRQGLCPATFFNWHGGTLHTWTHPASRDEANFDIRTMDRVATCVGPIWFRGRFGTAALDQLLRDIDTNGRIDETSLRGNFALFLRTNRHCLLINDVLGLIRVYTSPDQLFHSTSWLATCAYSGSVTLDEAAASEYVLLGASHSEHTVAKGISTLPLAHAIDLDRKRKRHRLATGIGADLRPPASFDDAVDAVGDHLNTVNREITAAFPGRTRAAISGGFDSRLIVAGLLASGARPDLFVYGNASSPDLPVARAIAESTGLRLDVINKQQRNRRRPPPDMEDLVQNALFFDGLPNDGLHDSGVDQQTRMQQTAGGCLALNGGGGEIFRNFFHLPDRPLRAIDVVRAFYRGFDSDVFRHPEDLSSYQERLATSMLQALGIAKGTSRQRLAREQVEWLYPLFRCHHWMAVNNSIAVRHGHYTTPLLDLQSARLACELPLAWKNAGRLQSRLITRLHPGIARQMSSYGFRFSDGPNWRQHVSEWATCQRPIFARPFISAARRHLHKQTVTPGWMAHGRSLLPGEWRLDPVLNLALLPDDLCFARALAVEVVWRELVA